ncbi:MAG: hypothetical protein IT461_04475 [Planctomycetes bacterium]|nr:hypothetical protein [Planctomycetota bacterium]
MPKRIHGVFGELSKAMEALRRALKAPLPFSRLGPGPFTQLEKMSFWKKCCSWQHRVACAYGWQKLNRPRCVRHSLLAALFKPQTVSTGVEDNRSRRFDEVLGSPPTELIWEHGFGSSTVMGMAPLTTPEIRGAWEGFAAKMNGGGLRPERFSAEEMSALISSPEDWLLVESFLRRRVFQCKEMGEALLRWVDGALSAAGLTNFGRLDREQKIFEAVRIAANSPELLDKEVAARVGVSPSWLCRQSAWQRLRSTRKRDRAEDAE